MVRVPKRYRKPWVGSSSLPPASFHRTNKGFLRNRGFGKVHSHAKASLQLADSRISRGRKIMTGKAEVQEPPPRVIEEKVDGQ